MCFPLQIALSETVRPPEMFKPIKPLKPLYSGDTTIPKIAITLDDGQRCDYRILDLLASYNIQCTVFIHGEVAKQDDKLMKRLHLMNFEICNHTFSHGHLKKKSDRQLKEDIMKGQEYITRRTGKFVPFLRPPYGEYDERTQRIAASLGYRLVIWSNTFCDTAKKGDAEKQRKWVEAKVKNGNIILCHFGGNYTFEIMRKLIPDLIAKGYSFCTLSEMLAATSGV